MASPVQVQKAFFEKLKSVIPHEQLSNNVAEVLKISVGEAYKKISGKSFINIEQILLLSDKFKIAFEYNPVQSINKAVFSYSNFISGENSIENYLDNFYKTLLHIKSVKNSTIFCTTDEIPIFHLFKYPALAAFKIYYWRNRQTKNRQSTKAAPFSVDSIGKPLIEKCLQLHQEYISIPSTEIWARTSIQNTLYQIEYALEALLIKNKDFAVQLYDQLESTINDVAGYAASETKATGEDDLVHFNWSLCENVASTTYLFKANDQMGCFQRFNTFNSLQTNDEAYCNEVNMWIRNIYKESICFSGQCEKERNVYVDSAINAIDAVKSQLIYAA